MTWRPKFVVCLSYYDRFRFRSDAFAALVLALQVFPLAIAIAIATGVHPLYGISCAVAAGLLASALGDSKVRVTAPSVVFVAVASSIVAREGILALSLAALLAGVLLVFFGTIGLGALAGRGADAAVGGPGLGIEAVSRLAGPANRVARLLPQR